MEGRWELLPGLEDLALESSQVPGVKPDGVGLLKKIVHETQGVEGVVVIVMPEDPLEGVAEKFYSPERSLFKNGLFARFLRCMHQYSLFIKLF